MQDCYEHTNSKGKVFYLHYADVKLRTGKSQIIYFFKRSIDTEGSHIPCQLPGDREVRENPRNGFCTVVRKRS